MITLKTNDKTGPIKINHENIMVRLQKLLVVS